MRQLKYLWKISDNRNSEKDFGKRKAGDGRIRNVRQLLRKGYFMRVNCNVSALIANNKLGNSQIGLSRALERLSSGLKINSAEDDAAGLAISNKLHTQIRGLEQANKNSADGVSVVQTAESALGETHNILQRIRELAVQAASDTNGPEDRQSLQVEIDQLADEIDRIASATEFNTMPLLDGTLGRRCYSDTDNVSMFYIDSSVKEGTYTFDVTADASQASATVAFMGGAVTQEGRITINGASMTADIGDTTDVLMTKFTQLCDAAGLMFDKTTNTITTQEYGISQKIEYSISTSLAGVFSVGNVQAGQDAAITLGTEGFKNTATVTMHGQYATITDIGGFEMTIELGTTLVADNGGTVSVTEKVTNIGSMTVQLGANEGQVLEIDIPAVDRHALGLDYLNVCTREAASDAMVKLDKAIEKVSAARSNLGAYQNRLDSVMTHLAAYREDITSAVSMIQDADMADEMTEYTQQNVITQAATSMLAQANERPQAVLQLLQ